MSYQAAGIIKELIESAYTILIIQADNPDADSLASSLALEQILGGLGKEPLMYCAIDVPAHLKYLAGWDRISNQMPQQFDTSIIVDASTMTLLEKLNASGQQKRLTTKPCLVLDHHSSVDNKIEFATATINDPESSSTGEVIYKLIKQLEWPLSIQTQEFLMTAILADTQGLSNSLASAETYRILADMVETGVDRPKLEENRRVFTKMPVSIFRYKAELIKRTEFHADGRLALVVVPQIEISQFSPIYNPAPLIQGDMLQTENVGVAIVLKSYDDGHITAAIRCNPTFPVGDKLAEHFNGGGHPFASGFKVTGRDLNVIKTETIRTANELIAKLQEL